MNKEGDIKGILCLLLMITATFKTEDKKTRKQPVWPRSPFVQREHSSPSDTSEGISL